MPAARARRGKSSSRSMPLAQPLRIDARLAVSMRCTSDSLLISSEKNATGVLALDRRVLRDVQRERRLSHRRTRRDDDRDPTGWKPDVSSSRSVKPLAHAGDRLAAALQRLDALHRRPEQLLDAREAVARLRCCATWKIFDSASSSSSVGSRSAPRTPRRRSPSRLRSAGAAIAFSRTILRVILDVRRGGTASTR